VVNKKKNPGSTQHELVVCNLEFPRIQRELLDLEDDQFESVNRTIEKIQKMTWDQVLKTASKTQKRGINWEPIGGQTTKAGKIIASIRVSQKFRARVCRDGRLMRFISLHPDHDSTYREPGGEDL
jgi:hypothetical protein